MRGYIHPINRYFYFRNRIKIGRHFNLYISFLGVIHDRFSFISKWLQSSFIIVWASPAFPLRQLIVFKYRNLPCGELAPEDTDVGKWLHLEVF